MLADLHLHSCCSDGTQTPGQIAQAAHDLGFGLIALADHNTCQGFEELQKSCTKLGIGCIRGMEVDCLYDAYELHILAYGFTPGKALDQLAALSRKLLLQMSDDLIEKMLPQYPQLSLTEYEAFDYNPTLGGWKGLHYLYTKGVTSTVEAGMRLYGQFGCDYSSYPFPHVSEVCAAIRESGGIPILAHPCNWFDAERPQELLHHLNALLGFGIGGIECYYPANTPKMTRLCLDFCRKHQLLITAGSDSHGDFSKDHHGISYYLGAVQVSTEKLVLGTLANNKAI